MLRFEEGVDSPSVADHAEALGGDIEISRPQVIEFVELPFPENPISTRIRKFIERKSCFFGYVS